MLYISRIIILILFFIFSCNVLADMEKDCKVSSKELAESLIISLESNGQNKTLKTCYLLWINTDWFLKLDNITKADFIWPSINIINEQRMNGSTQAKINLNNQLILITNEYLGLINKIKIEENIIFLKEASPKISVAIAYKANAQRDNGLFEEIIDDLEFESDSFRYLIPKNTIQKVWINTLMRCPEFKQDSMKSHEDTIKAMNDNDICKIHWTRLRDYLYVIIYNSNETRYWVEDIIIQNKILLRKS